MAVQERHYGVKDLILGMVLAFITNVILVSNSFAVQGYNLMPGEICLIKGVIQIILFLGLALVDKQQSSSSKLFRFGDKSYVFCKILFNSFTFS